MERPRPRSQPVHGVYIPPCGGGQRLPPGVWDGTLAMCNTGDDTSGVRTRSGVPHLKGPVLCHPGLHLATTTRLMTVVHDRLVEVCQAVDWTWAPTVDFG